MNLLWDNRVVPFVGVPAIIGVTLDMFGKNRQLYALARLVGRRDWENVEAAARRLLEVHPSDPLALEYLATALEQQGELASAVETRRRLHELCPTDFTNLRSLADLLWQLGDRQGALPFLRLAIAQAPQHEDFPWTLRLTLNLLSAILGRPGLGTRTALQHAQRRAKEAQWLASAKEFLNDPDGVDDPRSPNGLDGPA